MTNHLIDLDEEGFVQAILAAYREGRKPATSKTTAHMQRLDGGALAITPDMLARLLIHAYDEGHINTEPVQQTVKHPEVLADEAMRPLAAVVARTPWSDWLAVNSGDSKSPDALTEYPLLRLRRHWSQETVARILNDRTLASPCPALLRMTLEIIANFLHKKEYRQFLSLDLYAASLSDSCLTDVAFRTIQDWQPDNYQTVAGLLGNDFRWSFRYLDQKVFAPGTADPLRLEPEEQQIVVPALPDLHLALEFVDADFKKQLHIARNILGDVIHFSSKWSKTPRWWNYPANQDHLPKCRWWRHGEDLARILAGNHQDVFPVLYDNPESLENFLITLAKTLRQHQLVLYDIGIYCDNESISWRNLLQRNGTCQGALWILRYYRSTDDINEYPREITVPSLRDMEKRLKWLQYTRPKRVTS